MSLSRAGIFAISLLLIGTLSGSVGASRAGNAAPEPSGWYAGDAHVHRDCGGAGGYGPVSTSWILEAMKTNDLAVLSLLADMGNGEVRDAPQDLPLVNGLDAPGSGIQRLLHWDAEWHFDPKGVTFDQKMIGGHLIILGLRHAERSFAEYTYPIIRWAKEQQAIVGFAHMQYLPDGIPEELNCCIPLEYPVETALGTSDFLMEDVDGNEAAIHGYYRLLNCGFRPGLAAGTDFPCNDRRAIGSLLTYVHVPNGNLTYAKWIEGIALGRTVISRNGHDEFLELKVNDTIGPGGEVRLRGKGTVRNSVLWSASKPLTGRVELVQNGNVVASREASASPGAPFRLETTCDFAGSGWLCARRMDSHGHQTHTAAVFVSVDGAPVRANPGDAEYFVAFIDRLIRNTSPGGAWSRYFARDLPAAQDRYRKAREIFIKIAAEARALR